MPDLNNKNQTLDIELYNKYIESNPFDSNEYQNLNNLNPDEVIALDTLDLLTDIDFYEKQKISLVNALVKKHTLWAIQQGLGKTVITLPFVYILVNMYNKKKALISVPNDKVDDFYKIIDEHTNLSVMKTTGSQKDVTKLKKYFDEVNVIIASHSAWTFSLDFNLLIYNKLDDFIVTVFDEAKGVEDNGYLNLVELARLLPYNAMLNATPVNEKSPQSTYNILYALDMYNKSYSSFLQNFCDYNEYTRKYSFKDVKLLKNLIDERTLFFSREELGIEVKFKTKFFRCFPSTEQNTFVRKGVMSPELLYSPETPNYFPMNPQTTPSLNVLIRIILGNLGTNKIIFVRNVISQRRIKDTLSIMGIDVEIFEANSGAEERFNAKTNAVMIISSDRGINLGSAEDLIIYDTPPDVYQYLYRAVRDLSSKELNLFWIYYPEQERNKMIQTYESIKKNVEIDDKKLNVLEDLRLEIKEMYNISL